MAGHSHSANIAVRKGKQDAVKARSFAKLSKNIMVAARKGPDPDSNFGLRHAIDLARAASMPRDKIEHATKKGAGLIEGIKMTEITYEGYGQNGVALIVECLSDNLNRTRPELTRIFELGGGKLAAAGSVLWMFKRRGVIIVAADKATEDKVMETALEAGADDMIAEDGFYRIMTGLESFEKVRQALDAAKIPTESAEMKYIPDNEADCDLDVARRTLKMVAALEGNDDVNAVHHSMKMTPEILALDDDE